MPKVGEHLLQLACVRFFRQYYPDLYCNLWHTNGTAIDKRNGGVLKGMGVIAGVPDLLFFYKGKLHGIELKTAKGTQSEGQKEWQKMALMHGGEYHIVRTVEQFVLLIQQTIQNG
jgi:hypothetical protein